MVCRDFAPHGDVLLGRYHGFYPEEIEDFPGLSPRNSFEIPEGPWGSIKLANPIYYDKLSTTQRKISIIGDEAMLKRLFLLSLVMLFLNFYAYAFDWRKLHEKADKKNVQEALTSVTQNPSSIESLYILGLAYLNLHQDNDAEETFNRRAEILRALGQQAFGLLDSPTGLRPGG